MIILYDNLVASLKLLLSKTCPNATSSFNHCAKEAISDVNQKPWYTDKSVKSINSPNLCATFTAMQNVNKDTLHTAEELLAYKLLVMPESSYVI